MTAIAQTNVRSTRLHDDHHELCFSRPHVRNALDEATLHALADAIDALSDVRELRLLTIRGEGKSFVAGADLSMIEGRGTREAFQLARLGQTVFDRLGTLPCVVVACVHGHALGGGCELAMACDLVLAEESAVFGQPEVRLGFVPGFGGTVRMIERMGAGAALRLGLLGDRVSAQEAFRLGLVDTLVKPGSLDQAVEGVLTSVRACGPQAIAAYKRLQLAHLTSHRETQMVKEAEAFAECCASAEGQEGIDAFLGKRRPFYAR